VGTLVKEGDGMSFSSRTPMALFSRWVMACRFH
jgi:hypothetical protein